MQVFTLLVYLIFHIFTHKILVITCLNKYTTASENFLWKHEIDFRRDIPIRRCCHKCEKLVQNNTSNFYCSSRESLNGTLQQFDFINVDNDNPFGVPECKKLETWRCVDIFKNNKPIELFCAQSTIGGKVLSVLKTRPHSAMRKCCSITEIYDSDSKMCVPSENTYELNKHFNRLRRNRHSIITNNTFPKCPLNDVVVEYHYGINNTDFPYQRSLMSHLTPDILSYNFCLDLAINQSELHWVIQACIPQEICKTTPCIRKCCMVGEIFVQENGTSNCIPSKGSIKPKFYQIDNWLEKNMRVQQRNVDGKY